MHVWERDSIWVHLTCQLQSLRVAACRLSRKVCWDRSIICNCYSKEFVTVTIHIPGTSIPHLNTYTQLCELSILTDDLQMRKLHSILFQTEANSRRSKSVVSNMVTIS